MTKNMSDFAKKHGCKMLVVILLVLCIALSAAVFMMYRGNDPKTCVGSDHAFTVLIMGDSQMAGAAWEGGYGKCISEIYPNATVVNLAQGGGRLTAGDIDAQWEFYLENATVMPDFILLDGGLNDLPYLRKEEFKETGAALVSQALCSLIERIHVISPDTRIIYTLMPPLAEWKDSEDGPPAYEIQERYWKQQNISASAYDYVTVLDFFALNPFSYPCGECYAEYFADSIHLNEAGYRKTFEHINNARVSHLVQQLDK